MELNDFDLSSLANRARKILDLVRGIVEQWQKDKMPRLAAALAFFATLSLPSALVLAIMIAGQFIGQQDAPQDVLRQSAQILDPASIVVVSAVLEAATRPRYCCFVHLMEILIPLIFKMMPDVDIAWMDVAIGAAVTSVLSMIGIFALGLYFQYADLRSAFGVAGSLIALLIWAYYSAQILLVGAEFKQEYAEKYGDGIAPKDGAIRLYARNEPLVTWHF